VGTGTSAHADTGARIGSNGAIQINGLLDSIPIVGGLLGSLLGTPTSIYGSARPGPSATLSLLGSPLITGSTAPVASQVPLPPVEVPALTSQGALSYAAGDVHVLPPGKAAFNGLTLSNGSKLVVQGPAVLVLGSLSMLSRGELSFDTTGGPVAIYVTGNVDMASGTLLGMTANDPSLVSFYMSGDGATANLAGTSQFYGSVYAPDAAVTVGNAFELHGSLAGGSVTLQDGAKVHVDRGLGSEWHDGSIPESVSWRIVELEVQRTRAGSSDPFVELGLDPALLAGPAGAHKLDDVLLDVQFENLLGVTVSYSGVESSFDWNLVRSVVDVTRKIL
jgi:hypothetical protein